MFLLRALLLCIAFALPATAAVTLPLIANPVATPGVDGAMTLKAEVTANGALTSVVFEYGADTAYGKKTAATFVSASGVSAPISVALAEKLTGGKRYHFRVLARNSAGLVSSPNNEFDVPIYAPVIALPTTKDLVGDSVTLEAKITTNGNAGTAFFEYSTVDPIVVETTEVDAVSLDGSEEAHLVSAEIAGLERDRTYSFRLIFRPPVGTDLSSAAATFFTNQLPVAKPDTFNLPRRRATSLDVRKNDTDADDDELKVTNVTAAAKGTATVAADGLSVVYVPGAAFRGSDTFTYTIADGFTAATPVPATVTIRSFGVLLGGNHGGVLVDENGDAVGYFKITATESGAFTGSVLVDGVKQSFSGVIAPDGTFRGTVKIDGELVSLALTATVNGDATTLDVKFDEGRWTASLQTTEASATLRAELAGRYTVGFPGGTSSSDPANDGGDPSGTGWAALKLGEDGVARIKGRLPDGRAFSTRGVLGVATTGTVVTMFDDPRRTRVAGVLTIGDAVAGTLRVERESGGSGLFSNGYSLQSTATGARYIPPADGRRAIEGVAEASGRQLTFATTGGDAGENFTRALRVGKDDDVLVVDRDSESLKVKIDRESGRFTAWFKGSTDNHRIKGTGVFIQGTSGSAIGRGAGVFTGELGTGTITITPAGAVPAPVTPAPLTPDLTIRVEP